MDKKNNRHDLENRQRTYSVFNYSHWLKHWPIRVSEWKFHYENYPRQVPDNLTNRHWLCRQSDSIPSKFILATSMLLTDFGDKNIVDKLWKVVTKLVNYYIISADSPDTRPLDGDTVLPKFSFYWLAYRLVKYQIGDIPLTAGFFRMADFADQWLIRSKRLKLKLVVLKSILNGLRRLDDLEMGHVTEWTWEQDKRMKVKTFDSEDPKQNHFTFFTILTIFTIFNQNQIFFRKSQKKSKTHIWPDFEQWCIWNFIPRKC